MKQLLAILSLFCVLMFSAYAENTWTCSKCGEKTNYSKYCIMCANPSPTPKPASTPQPASPLPSGPKIGDFITFGHYEQDNDLSNGKEPIEWLVLDYDKTEHKAMLISRYCLAQHWFDYQGYNGWDKSEIRRWLNTTFLNIAFSAEEQESIVTTDLNTPFSAIWENDALQFSGNVNTHDKIWLLSYSDIKGVYREAMWNHPIMPTEYARRAGAQVITVNETSSTVFWLRSPGISNLACTYETFGFTLDVSPISDYVAVRPALWLDLNSASCTANSDLH